MRGPIPGFKKHILTVIACGLAFIATALWLLHIGGALPTSAGHYTVRALVPSAQSVATGSQVTMAGAPVGRVTGVKRQGLGGVITLELSDHAVTPLRADATAQIRARTPVGENYVAIQPGRSQVTLRDGGQLRIARGDGFVDIDKLLSAFQGRTRTRLRALIQQTADGLEGRGDRLNTLLGGVSTAFTQGSTVVNTLADERERVGSLVANLGSVASAIGERQQAIATTAQRGLVAFRAIADRDRQLATLIDELPPTLDSVRRATTALHTSAITATPVVANLSDAVREVRPAVRLLQPAAIRGATIVKNLGAAAPGLERTLDRVQSLAGPTARALPQVRRALCQVNPILRYAKPYTPDIVQALVGLGSAANAYDGIGHTIRLLPVVNENSLVGLPAEMSKGVADLLHSGLLSKSTSISYQPFMKPGDLGHITAEDVTHQGKSIVGPDGVRESGFKYPRIMADC